MRQVTIMVTFITDDPALDPEDVRQALVEAVHSHEYPGWEATVDEEAFAEEVEDE